MVWEFCGGLRESGYPILSALYIDNCDDFDWCFTLVRSWVNKQEVSKSIRNCWLGPRCSFLSLRKELFHTVLWVLCSAETQCGLWKGSGKGVNVAVGPVLRQHLCQTLPTQGSGNRETKKVKLPTSRPGWERNPDGITSFCLTIVYWWIRGEGAHWIFSLGLKNLSVKSSLVVWSIPLL